MPHRPRPVETAPATKLADLLPIPPAVSKPNAYQVFGLTGGEHDDAVVTEAMQQAYQGLKDAKPTADPTAWNQAAKLAEAARKLLEDPARRRALDESLAADNASEQPTESPQPAASSTESVDPNDPLAGLLPAGKPLSTPAPGSAPSGAADPAVPAASSSKKNQASAVLGMPPGVSPKPAASVLGTPPLGTAAKSTEPVAIQTDSTTTPAVQPASSVGDWAPPKPKRKKRKKNTAVFLLGFFVLFMLGAIIGLLQFLSSGGRLALTPDGVPADSEGIVVSDPAPSPGRTRTPTDPSDGVIGAVPSSGIAESLRNPDAGDAPAEDMNPAPTTPDPVVPEMTPEPTPTPEATPTPEPTPTPEATPTPEPTPEPPMGPTAEVVQANEAKIKAVEELIRTANWSEMKAAADGLLKLELTEQQSDRASTLFDIADLTVFYRGAIVRGLATLKTGNTFEITEDFPVIVSEVTADSLSIQYNRRVKTFTVDQLPPRLAEKIASFALSSEQPDAIAGQALYRLIHPQSRGEYRADSLEMLASVDGELEKVDTGALQRVVKEIFAE